MVVIKFVLGNPCPAVQFNQEVVLQEINIRS